MGIQAKETGKWKTDDVQSGISCQRRWAKKEIDIDEITLTDCKNDFC